MWVNVDELVSEALADVAKGKIISIPTRRFKVMTFVARHAPRGGPRAVKADELKPALVPPLATAAPGGARNVSR